MLLTLLALLAALVATVAVLRVAQVSQPASAHPDLAAQGTLAPQASVHPRPAKLSVSAAVAISARLGRDLPAYGVRRDTARGVFAASTPNQGLAASFTATGAEISHRRARLSLAVTAIDGRRLSAVAPDLQAGRVTYAYTHAGIRAWYANGPLGIEQGFRVDRRAAQTTVQMHAAGLEPHLSRRGLAFGRALRYIDLSARDARGRPLRAWLTTRASTVSIHVDTAGAHFPVSIDPLVQQATLEPSVTTGIDAFGMSVAVAGNLLVVGDPSVTEQSGGNEAAYVFQRGANGWSDADQVAKLTAANGDLLAENFGSAVAISPNGQAIAVGGPSSELDGRAIGAVYLYDKPASGGWTDATQSTAFTPVDPSSEDEYGSALSLSDDALLVGDPAGNADAGLGLYYSEPARGWTTSVTPVQFAGADDEELGTSVALSPDDTTVVLGAPQATVLQTADVGEVEVLTEPSGGWGAATPASALLVPSDINRPPGANSMPGNDLLGSSVAISADGSTIAAGEPEQNENANADLGDGAVDVFVKPSSGWVSGHQTAELYDADFASADDSQLGSAVTFAGSSVIAGDSARGDGAGAIYEFDEPTGGWSTAPSDPLSGPTFSGPTNSDYGSSVSGDADSVVVGETGGDDFVGSALAYSYSAPGATTPTTTTAPTTSTQTPAPSTTTQTPGTSTPSPSPSRPPATPTPTGIDFTISPDVEPVLSGQTLSFSASNPGAVGVSYEWDFDDTTISTGASVTHTFTGAGVYTVILAEQVAGQPAVTVSHNVIVVQAQAPSSDFTVVRTSQQGGTGASTAVTDPVTIVPSAALPQVDASAQDTITKIEYWFDAKDAPRSAPCVASGTSHCYRTPPATPDLTCLPDGSCGYYGGTSDSPSAADLTPVPGVTDLGAKPVYADGSTVGPAGCLGRNEDPACQRYTPTNGFGAIQINFWNAALAQIGDGTNAWASTPEIPVGPQREAVASTNASGNVSVSQPAETVPYAPFSQLNLAGADGFQGEQGVPDADCFPGNDYSTGPCRQTAETWQAGPPAEAGGELVDRTLFSTIFGPYDLSHSGVNSAAQLEDQWNLLYNYATVVGVDTPLDAPLGPATGATEGAGKATVPRTVTMVAYNAEGIPSAEATEQVPLTPAANPSFSVCIEDVSGSTPCVVVPKKNGTLPFTIDTGDTLKFVVNGAGGGDEPITRYAIAVGQPNTATVDTSVGKLDQCGAPTEVGSWMTTEAGAQPSTPTASTTGGDPDTSSGTSQPITQKSAPSGPARRSELTRTGRITTSASTVPPFSDLMAGAFAPHDCEGYSERTVNAAAAPGAAPQSGPTVTLHTDSERSGHSSHTPVAPEPVAGDLYPTPSLAGVPTVTTPAPTVATGAATKSSQAPVLITSNPDKLDFSFARVGTYSASIAAYNSAGLGAITRVDGFLAQRANPYGFCVSVQSESFAIPVPAKHGTTSGNRDLGFSGNCMTVIRHGSNDQLYASTQPIDVNGVPLAPSANDSIVISPDTDSFYVAHCDITRADLTEKIKNPENPSAGGHASPCPASHLGTLYLALGSGSDHGTNLPGFARLTDFSTQKADAFLLPLTTQPLPKVGSTPGANTAQEKDATNGCGLYGFSQPWPNSPGAKYDGFPIASVNGPCIAFTTRHGAARVAFWDSLPTGFSNGASRQPDSSQVVLYGSDLPAVSDLSYNPYANVALARHRPPTPQIAGDLPTLAPAGGKIRPADELPGFPKIPDCPASANGKSGLAIPQDTSLGPISLGGASFCYIAKTGDFIGNVSVNIPGPVPINGVTVGFEIGHGRLIDAGGELSGSVPIFPGVFLNDFKFDIQTDPTVVAAAITASIIDVLDVQGGVIIKPSLPEVDFEGDVSIAGITFGNFDMDYTRQGLGLSMSFGKDFGPASLNISVKGALSTSPASFYLEGSGDACLFLCLPVAGLVSNQGLAACGTINLLLVSFSGGFAVNWSGPDSGVHLFTGCDLDPWIPANLANVHGAIRTDPAGLRAAERRANDGTLQAPVAPGGTESLPDLHQTGMCPDTFVHPTSAAPSAVFRVHGQNCTAQTEAIQIHSLYDPSDPGATPLVSLTNASGDTRVPATPVTPGYWGLNSSAALSGGTANADDAQTDGSTWLVDQNPVPTTDDNPGSSAYCPATAASRALSVGASCAKVTTTTIYIGDPGPGDWTLHVLPGSEPVVDVSTANEMPAVDAADIGHTVLKPTLTGSGDNYAIHIGAKVFTGSAISDHTLMLAPSIETTPSSATARRAMIAHPRADDLDVSPINAPLLRSIQVKLPAGLPGTVAIIDQGNGCASTCSQVLASGLRAGSVPSGGEPLVFEPITAGSTQTIQAFISNAAGMPSKVITLATITSPSLPRPRAPILVKTVRDGSVVHLYVNVTDAPSDGSIALALRASDGTQYDQNFSFAGGAISPVASSPYAGVGAARHHTIWEITVPDVDPTASLHVALASLNDGVLGASSAQHAVRQLLPSLTDHQLLVELHLK